MFLETVLKLGGGGVLLLLPLSACHILGLPKPQSGFWPRLLGSVLVGIGGATYIEGATPTHGLGMAGCALINIVAVAVIVSMLILGGIGKTRRARWVFSLLAVLLGVLGLAELTQI
ncbi:MAG: hypothetical protein K0U74_09945 [Alphaproteobacteria bacterium]|nr:hypothetical protein [Alphaproteobacteria bacterium]